MRYFNPYSFLIFVPLAVIAGIVFIIISFGKDLESTPFIILILVLIGTITFLSFKLSRQNSPLKNTLSTRGDVDSIVQKILEKRKSQLSQDDVVRLKTEVQNIYSSTYRRAERTMRIKEIMDQYLNKP